MSVEPSNSYPPVLWIDDERNLVDEAILALKQFRPTDFQIEVVHVPEFSEIPKLFHSIRSEPSNIRFIFHVFAIAETEPHQLRRIFSEYRFSGIISDLNLQDDEIGGLSILSAATIAVGTPELALCTGHLNKSAERLARSVGVKYVLSKQEDRHKIVRILGRWLEIPGIEEIDETVEYKRRIEQLYSQIHEFERTQRLLKRRLREATSKSGAPASVKKEKTSSKTVATNEETLQLLQLIKAHNHDLASSSEMTLAPLDRVLGNLNIIPPAILKDLQSARTAAKHCSVLVKSIPDLQGGLGVPNALAQISSVISDAVDIVGSRMPPGVKIQTDVPTRLPTCAGPEVFLVRCLLNLILNAFDAMPKGGLITIRSFSKSEKLLGISVQDTGIGFKAADLKRAFDPSFSTKKKKNGFGLFIVKRIVEELHGEIQIKSKRGKGALVEIFLPKA